MRWDSRHQLQPARSQGCTRHHVMAYAQYSDVSKRNMCAWLPTWLASMHGNQTHQQGRSSDPHRCMQDKHGWGCCLHQPA